MSRWGLCQSATLVDVTTGTSGPPVVLRSLLSCLCRSMYKNINAERLQHCLAASAAYAVMRCLCVRPSVRLVSVTLLQPVVSKRFNISQTFSPLDSLHHSPWFFRSKPYRIFRRGGGVLKNRDFRPISRLLVECRVWSRNFDREVCWQQVTVTPKRTWQNLFIRFGKSEAKVR